MNTKKKNTVISNEITPGDLWNEDKIKAVKAYILTESSKQSAEDKLKVHLLSIKYQMQAYIKNDNQVAEMQIIDFVKLYLKSLKITQKDLATAFEMKPGNLYKYLNGERKLNPDIALKLSAFSHTPPELWYHIQTKNELQELRKEKGKLKKYEKYDYEKMMVVA